VGGSIQNGVRVIYAMVSELNICINKRQIVTIYTVDCLKGPEM
jgi:hypothetical protein